MKVGCWKSKAGVGYDASADVLTNCEVDAAAATNGKFNPVMNNYTGNTGELYQAKFLADAATAKAGFGDGDDDDGTTDNHISLDEVKARANA